MAGLSLKQKVGDSITEFFIIKRIDSKLKRSDNNPYLVLELGYPEGRIWANIWDNIDEFSGQYNTGDIVKIQGTVEQYKEQLQIRINKIRKSVLSDDVHPEDLLPVYQGKIKNLNKKLEKEINRINEPYLKELCRTILLDSEFNDIFSKAPGGKLWHHAYVGGLLEHTLNVVSICDLAAELYPDVNKDLILAGALLHDIGKAESYDIVPYVDYSDEGRLIGHIVIGYEKVKQSIDKTPDFPAELEKNLLHMILAHQGELEKASPVVPMTIESIILHYADELDAKSNAFSRIIKEQKTPDRKWSNYVNLMDRFIYFGGNNS
ncbi:3'-5' exoribonuclease YhaM family protein [candidate division KSB1 bacterium]